MSTAKMATGWSLQIDVARRQEITSEETDAAMFEKIWKMG